MQEGGGGQKEAALVPTGGQSWYEQEMPYEQLVGYIDHFVERARSRHPENPFSEKDPFSAAEWLGWQLRQKALVEGDGKGPYVFSGLKTAWDALAYDRYTSDRGRWREWVRGELEYTAQTKQTSLSLPPKSVKLLDAMAEVAGVPRKRGESTIDLSSFATPSGNNQLQAAGK